MNFINSDKIRKDFPILQRQVNGKPLIYFDNGATSQKPQQVIDVINRYYQHENSNIHRGIHTLSQEATNAYEKARTTVLQFINAKHNHEVIFTSGTTGSINLVASSFGKKHIHAGDEIIISTMEHHSNIVPWQMLCEEKKAILKVIPINDKGELLIDEFKKLLSPKTKLVAVTHVSNTLGTINPVKEIIKLAKTAGAFVLIDGAQAVPHTKVNVQELDCDFYAFSAHKMFGPTGVGILYGKEAILNELPPYQGGGDMIKTVTFEKTTYNELPHKFEAGTPNIVGGLGLAAAIDYMNNIGIANIEAYEHELLSYATEKIKKIEGVRIIGEAANKASVLSFLVDGTHPSDIGMIIDKLGIAIRTGHHCTEPLMNRFDIPGTARASFAFYNTKEEIDTFILALERALKMLL
ncbi:MAG: cysteine desulfurase CsdA [Flavobacteriales bacterium]|nr:cysteine desulfurase CsdA [Flavobacteriales bacterium]|tara:strand:+ start:23835 stop:25058 length:1224 start_codon:yes stop_codon:yes gene_type:complete